MKILGRRKQEDWGIPKDFVSPLGWNNAIFELRSLGHHLTPSMQLMALARCIKAIYSEFKVVLLPRLQALGKNDIFLGADDLVPIFLFVLCHTDLAHPVHYKEQMWALCHPGQLIGESGYYLTVFESAIEHIREFDEDALSAEMLRTAGQNQNKGQRKPSEKPDAGSNANDEGRARSNTTSKSAAPPPKKRSDKNGAQRHNFE
jgi:hypothetical protein